MSVGALAVVQAVFLSGCLNLYHLRTERITVQTGYGTKSGDTRFYLTAALKTSFPISDLLDDY
jgi:hypothetical protein